MLSDSIRNKLEQLGDNFEEMSALLSDPDVISDNNRFRELSQEYSRQEPVVQTYQRYETLLADIETAKEMVNGDDPEMAELAKEELADAKQQQEELETELQKFLLPRDPHDDSNIFLEIRAGTGGDEAAIFSGDLLKMYLRFADSRGWSVETITERDGDHGGYKEVIARIVGHGAYSQLKFESGVHRVQRVPETESQGRIHTSACTVAILPEIDEVEAIEINPADLRVDTFRASGAGGQHVNKTDSAIRLTHIPTGTVVECQDERSQHKNRARAMSLLQSRLLTEQQDAQDAEQASTRKNLVGSGDRSERIRTYNYPQGRVTDHRINLTLHKLDEIMAGGIDEVIGALLTEHQAGLLADLTSSEL